MTQIEAIEIALKNLGKPSTASEIYDQIIADGNGEVFDHTMKPVNSIHGIISRDISSSTPKYDRVDRGIFDFKSKSTKTYMVSITKEEFLYPYFIETILDSRNNSFHGNLYGFRIDEGKSSKKGTKTWFHPDIVAYEPSYFSDNVNIFYQNAKNITKYVGNIYSFELKHIDNTFSLSEFIKWYAEASFNSSWANYGYLVIDEYDNNMIDMDILERLNELHGIGLIYYNVNDDYTEIIIKAKYKELDYNTISILDNDNHDFNTFLSKVNDYISSGILVDLQKMSMDSIRDLKKKLGIP